MFAVPKGFELPLLPDISDFSDNGKPFVLQSAASGTMYPELLLMMLISGVCHLMNQSVLTYS